MSVPTVSKPQPTTARDHRESAAGSAASDSARSFDACRHETMRIARGSGYTLAARIAMASSRGIGLILISRTLGAERFGDYALLVAAFAISSSLGTLGIDQAHIYLTGSKRHSLRVMLSNSAWFALFLGILSGLLLWSSVHLLRTRIFDTTPMSGVYLTAAVLPAILYHNYLQGIALGHSWFRYYSAVEIAKWCLHVVILGVAAATKRLDVTTALFALYVPIALAGVGHLVALLREGRIGLAELMRSMPRSAPIRESLHYGVRASLVHVTQVLHLRLDVYLVKYFTSTAVVGQYALAVNVVDVILYAGRSVGLVVFARRALDPNPTAGPVPAVTRLMLVAVSLFATAVFLLRDPLIETFFGSVYLACTAAIACRLPGIVAESLSVVLVSDYLGRANTRPPLIWNGIAVGTGLVLNVLLVPHGGIVAAASAFSIASWTRAMGLVHSHARLSHGRRWGYFWGGTHRGSPWLPATPVESAGGTKSTEVGR